MNSPDRISGSLRTLFRWWRRLTLIALASLVVFVAYVVAVDPDWKWLRQLELAYRTAFLGYGAGRSFTSDMESVEILLVHRSIKDATRIQVPKAYLPERRLRKGGEHSLVKIELLYPEMEPSLGSQTQPRAPDIPDQYKIEIDPSEWPDWYKEASDIHKTLSPWPKYRTSRAFYETPEWNAYLRVLGKRLRIVLQLAYAKWRDENVSMHENLRDFVAGHEYLGTDPHGLEVFTEGGCLAFEQLDDGTVVDQYPPSCDSTKDVSYLSLPDPAGSSTLFRCRPFRKNQM